MLAIGSYDDLIISHAMSSLPTKPSQQVSASRPLVAPNSLTHQLAAQLTADIVEGRLTSGSQLPTEQEMVAANRVSRTWCGKRLLHCGPMA